ncbi:hypothetical protein EDC55_101100 [Allofrancisella inopinata]|uniref:Uncharacterized protein n=1 Tax=Allofrancisella inopinata TaxID=1085647 RepID=A0AAE6YK52_9GAMM|nr:hypothetical protein [Allofrancisella inopinata]QIV96282.1 hypothetical protein E4K63_05325 [Allofrancisella inopinata]TDT74555.1 hypothetical protein EDC55_101100 [Allofrancisella inopinata]
MTISIIPEKISNIDKYKTRSKITNSTQANKELINKTKNLILSIEVANKELKKLDIPYLNDAEIVYYEPEKIICKSQKEILKFKIKELQSQFIEILKKSKLFSKLKKIEVLIDYSNNKTTKKIPLNPKAKQALQQIRKDLKI